MPPSISLRRAHQPLALRTLFPTTAKEKKAAKASGGNRKWVLYLQPMLLAGQAFLQKRNANEGTALPPHDGRDARGTSTKTRSLRSSRPHTESRTPSTTDVRRGAVGYDRAPRRGVDADYV
ncbi:hypothetical protein D9615_007040 [Tricholomella constricta]|uniref:Uncharacterized protein n=1 Tax=Tricholomella constricta TaxID=117010 RepID=A0A8H5H843_9AGAR|nr:hypothetical protein D9615_007040 [Tricholomella constricta]